MKFIAIAYPMSILIIVIAFLNFYNWHNESVYEFDQRQMDLQVNYATDAATQEMLAGSYSLETDYVDWGKMSVSPNTAYDTFLAVMLRNYGWTDTEENRQALDELVPFFLICTYDGYYLYKTEKVPNDAVATEFDPRSEKYNGKFPAIVSGTGASRRYIYSTIYRKYWTPKIPYAEHKDGSYWMYYLGSRYGSYYNGASLKQGEQLLTQEMRDGSMECIANCINAAVNEGLNSGLGTITEEEFFIPADYTKYTRTNAVKHPTCITFLQREDAVSQFNVLTLGIGGAKIDEANFVICYQRNGEKMYAMAKYRSMVEAEGIKVLKVLESPDIAAAEGYWFDLSYLE